MNTGELIVERADAQELKDIKMGKWGIERVTQEAQKLFKEMEKAKDESPLPEHIDFDRVNDLVVEILSDYLVA